MICDYHFQKAFAFLKQNIYIKKKMRKISKEKNMKIYLVWVFIVSYFEYYIVYYLVIVDILNLNCFKSRLPLFRKI